MNKIKNFFVIIFNAIKRFINCCLKKIKQLPKKCETVYSQMRKTDSFKTFISSLICIIAGLIVGFLLIIIVNAPNSGKAILSIIKGGFNAPIWKKGVGAVVVNTVPLILCSLSIIFAYKCGLFNIGAPGQYVIGLMFALLGAFLFKLPWYLCVILSMIGGALWGTIPGLFKAYLNVNEVITSIMFNWISLYLMNFVAGEEAGIMFNKKLSECNELPPSALIPQLDIDFLFGGYKYVTIAVIFAVIAAIAINVILTKTKFGFEIKATGYNKDAAKCAGMKYRKNIILTMAISGALAGLAASCFYLTGYEIYSAAKQTSLPQMGFNGIAAAFLGGLSPIGAIFASLFITHINVGGGYLDTTYYSSEIANMISAFIIYLCAFSLFIKDQLKKRDKIKEEQRKQKNSLEIGSDNNV